MKCNQATCPEPAEWFVYWPGRPRLPMCDRHKRQAQGVGHTLGCVIPTEPLSEAIAAAAARIEPPVG